MAIFHYCHNHRAATRRAISELIPNSLTIGHMSKETSPQFSIGARVRIKRVAFPESQKQFLGKTGTVQANVTSFGSIIVLLDDGPTRVCLPENLELIGERDLLA